MQTTKPTVLTIATTDSGGGAGIQADLKTMTSLGAFSTSVAVALTAQNPLTVLGIHELPADFVRLQFKAVTDAFTLQAVKVGMVYSAELIKTVAELLGTCSCPVVIDPVCVSQSGFSFLADEAVGALRQHLIPQATLFTPNKPEAEVLADMEIHTENDVIKAVEKFCTLGAKSVLIKGGHFAAVKNVMTDWYYSADGQFLALPHEWINTENNHGTGCTLSSAIATYLAFGFPMDIAIVKAQEYLLQALRTSFSTGKGPGSPNFKEGAVGL